MNEYPDGSILRLFGTPCAACYRPAAYIVFDLETRSVRHVADCDNCVIPNPHKETVIKDIRHHMNEVLLPWLKPPDWKLRKRAGVRRNGSETL